MDRQGSAPDAGAHALVDDLFRRQAAQIVSTLTRILGPEHLSLAEDVTQETLIAALRHWPYSGVPDNPGGWMLTVARNKALDAIRRERTQARSYRVLASGAATTSPGDLSQALDLLDEDLRDDQLRMMFMCCHPALSPESRVALTLKTLGGLSVPEIARAFLAKEQTIAQRLTRAKRTLRDQRVSFVVPSAADLPERLDSVLDALYLLFNEGYSAHSGDALVRRDLCAEAIRLATLLTESPVGDAPRVHALLALLLLQASRLPARTDGDGALLLLDEQDRSRWDRAAIVAGLQSLARSATGDCLSVYHLQAEIAACHAVAPEYAATDWQAILRCYDELMALAPSPVVALNRAVALAMVRGPEAGAAEVDCIAVEPGMATYHLYHATRAELLRRAGDLAGAAESYARALELTRSEPERRFLEARFARVVRE